MPVHFESGIPQAWAWTLLAPWIQSCPKENPKVGWSNFPALTIKDEPKLQFDGAEAAVSTNRSALTHPSERIDFTWEEPGKQVGPDLAYTTSKNGAFPLARFSSHKKLSGRLQSPFRRQSCVCSLRVPAERHLHTFARHQRQLCPHFLALREPALVFTPPFESNLTKCVWFSGAICVQHLHFHRQPSPERCKP